MPPCAIAFGRSEKERASTREREAEKHRERDREREGERDREQRVGGVCMHAGILSLQCALVPWGQ